MATNDAIDVNVSNCGNDAVNANENAAHTKLYFQIEESGTTGEKKVKKPT